MSFLIHNLWHQCLKHLGYSHFKLFSHYISTLNPFVKHESYETCPLAKQTRTPFPLSNKRSIEPSDLIHCDIWGKFYTTFLSGAHYFLTINMDDFHHCP